MAPFVREASDNPAHTLSPALLAQAGGLSEIAFADDRRARFGFLPRFRQASRARIGLDPVLGRIGSLEVRLASTPKDVRRAQRLRFKVFYDEGSAAASGATLLSRRDRDDYDAVCDHLLVLDHDAKPGPFRAGRPEVVGTYRLLRQDVAQRHHGFYSAGEYDVARLVGAHPGLRFLELGRSCVLKPYRTKRAVELL